MPCPKLKKRQAIGVLLGIIYTLSLCGLWDLARFQVHVKKGFYDFPFGITLPWYIAGDILVAIGLVALLIDKLLEIKA